MSYVGADYNQLHNEFYYSKTRNLNNSGQSRYAGSAPSANPQEVQCDSYVSQKGNTCTDGNDDGKIGIFSKIGNTIEGVGKTAVNMVKGAVKHPFKTAAMIGACFIPVVGPFIAGGLATYGVAKGVSTVASGVSTAMSATNDAQAKDAWESIGEGTFTAGLSGLALKGSAGQLKSQLNGGSTTVNALKKLKTDNPNATVGDFAQKAISEGIKETGAKGMEFAGAAVKKVSNAFKKGREYVDIAKNSTPEELAQIAKDKVGTTADKAGLKAKEVVDNASGKIKDVKAKYSKKGRAAAKAEKSAAIEKQITEGTRIEIDGKNLPKGVTKAKGGYQKVDGDTTSLYNSKGELTQQVIKSSDQTITYKYKAGTKQTVSKSIADKNGNSAEYKNFDDNLYAKNENKTTVDGSKTTTKTTNNETGTIKIQRKIDNKTANSTYYNKNTKTGYLKKTDGSTVYVENGNIIKNPTAIQKARIKAQVSDNVISTTAKANEILDYQIPRLNEYTNPFLQTGGAVLLENQE